MQRDTWTLAFAGVFAAIAVLTLAFWIPHDIESGIVETFRRRTSIGDALAPSVIAIGLLVVSVAMGISAWLRPAPVPSGTRPDRQSLQFVARLSCIIALGLVLMNESGPVSVDLLTHLGQDVGSYRELRDTVPFKYIGYALGGFVMVFGVISMVESRASRSAALVSIVAVLVLIILYDLPFDHLLLPPNGDQ